MSKGLEIETCTDLRGFFYEGLSRLNNKSLAPVCDEIVIYSSDVLEKHALNANLYKEALGLNFLKAELMEYEQKKKVYKDVADTALVLVGYFSQSINSKLISHDYYIQIGQMAYQRMDSIYPDYLDIPGFYKRLSCSFEGLTTLLKVYSKNNEQDPFKHLLLDELNDRELLVSGISKNESKNVS